MPCRILSVKILPHSKKNELNFVSEDSLIIKLSTPPEKGKANEKMIELLSKELNIPKKNISIKHGEHSRNKIIHIIQ